MGIMDDMKSKKSNWDDAKVSRYEELKRKEMTGELNDTDRIELQKMREEEDEGII